jgi:hypothetical protein
MIPSHEEIKREGWDTAAAEYWKAQYEASQAQVAALHGELRSAWQRLAKYGVDHDDATASLLLDTAAAAAAHDERIARDAREREREQCAKALDDPALLEALADAEHQRWVSWMRYQQTASPEKRADWPRKVALVYWGLTNEEQESDRIEARKTLEIIRNRIRALNVEAPLADPTGADMLAVVNAAREVVASWGPPWVIRMEREEVPEDRQGIARLALRDAVRRLDGANPPSMPSKTRRGALP